MADGKPFLGVPQGNVRVENPDGVYRTPSDHSLYDREICEPVIPGDYDLTMDAPLRTRE